MSCGRLHLGPAVCLGSLTLVKQMRCPRTLEGSCGASSGWFWVAVRRTTWKPNSGYRRPQSSLGLCHMHSRRLKSWQDIDVDAPTARKLLEAVASRKQAGQRQKVGRTLGLKSAYKQLASAPSDGWGEHSGGLSTGRTAVSVYSICYFSFWCSALGCGYESRGEDVEDHIAQVCPTNGDKFL